MVHGGQDLSLSNEFSFQVLPQHSTVLDELNRVTFNGAIQIWMVIEVPVDGKVDNDQRCAANVPPRSALSSPMMAIVLCCSA